MSNHQAIAAVTATLRSLLEESLGAEIPGISVTSKAPDKAHLGLEGQTQLNVFLFQASINAAWRNRPVPSQVKPGEVGYPPLALNLYYVITAYAPEDDEIACHKVLGKAMSFLHDHPELGPDEITLVMPGSELQNQIERVRITPHILSLEDLSKLWSALQTQYRLSMMYHASVVLIESTRASKAPLPVLSRGPGDKGLAAQADLTPPYPTITAVVPPNNQANVRLGDTITITGTRLDGDAVKLRIMSARWSAPVELNASPGATSTTVAAAIPVDAAGWPAGPYVASVVVSRASGQTRVTNELGFALSPRIMTIAPNPLVRDAVESVTLALSFEPEILPDQRVSLFLDDREIPAPPHGKTDSLSFTFSMKGEPAGDRYVRLRVDGVDSVLIDRTVVPPIFDRTQRVTIQ
jgi:hypothetical protein